MPEPVLSHHCVRRWAERFGTADPSRYDYFRAARREALAAIRRSRAATLAEVAAIRQTSRGAAHTAKRIDYRIADERIVFVIGPSKREPKTRVAVTCYPAPYIESKAA